MKSYLFKKIIISAAILFLVTSALFADTTYKVQKGDTLYSISRKYQLSVDELRKANHLKENDVIKLGQTLVIPSKDEVKKEDNSSIKLPEPKDPDVYVVQKGDTLYSIARKHGTSVDELLEINGLGKNAVIQVGQTLKVKDDSYKTHQSSKTPITGPEDNIVIPEKAPDTRDYGKVLDYGSNVVWPVSDPVVTQVRGKISGVQLSAKSRESVKCVHEGTVMFVGTYRGFGQVIFVQSKIGLIYAYTGLGSIKVKKGQYVVAGDKIGTAGVDPLTGKPQITFMVFQNGKPIDPAKAPRSF